MLLASLSFLLLSPFLSISTPPDINPLFDQYYTILGIKAENARLDNYAFQLRHAPEARGLIVVYAENEKTAKAAKTRARRAFTYLVKTCGLNPARVVWRYDAACGKEQIKLYVLYPDQVDPARDTRCERT